MTHILSKHILPGEWTDGKGETTTQTRSNDMSLETKRMRTGQTLVFTGFGISVVGIVLYCMAGFSADAAQTEPVFIKESLGVIGVGVMVWLVGAVKYMNGAINSNASDEHSIF